jgi:hypothetical protein
VVEVDQAEIPFRTDNSFFDPAKMWKNLGQRDKPSFEEIEVRFICRFKSVWIFLL